MSELEADDDAGAIAEHVEQPGNPEVIDAAVWKFLIDGLTSLERHVAEAHADTPHDALVELRNCVMVIQQRAADLRAQIDGKFVTAIRAHGPIDVGTIRFIVGIDRTTRCLNTKSTTEFLLNAVGGDLFRFCDQLVAQPFKPASVRALIAAEEYRVCFETVERSSVEKLMKVDTRFLKPKA